MTYNIRLSYLPFAEPRDEALELEGVLASEDDNDDAGGFKCKLSTEEILFLGFKVSEGCELFDVVSLSNKDSRLFFQTWGLKSLETMLARFNVISSSDVNDVSLFSEPFGMIQIWLRKI